MASELGKRYQCAVCGSEALCVKSGDGTIACDGQDMEIQEPRVMPSSD
ncbi:desulfoferrodoxin [Chloroflexota bacterium]